MMKTKKLFLLLAMLLMSIGASAQSQLKGDVNNDGKVDEADITAVIEIMKNGGGVTDSNDVNKDGKVDVADIVAIIGIIKNGGSSSGEVFDPNSYYIYIGLNRPTSDTDIAADLASNNTPLIEGMASMGWRNIGQDISIYNSGNEAFYGGRTPVCLDKNFNNVTCYVAIPVGMGIFDGLGYDLTPAWTLVQENVTIKGHQYNVYVDVLEGEFTAGIYSKGGSTSSETKYYWYAGPDMLTSATVPGVNEGNDCGYGWHVIEGNPTSIETGELGTSDCQKINWVLAVPAKFGLNHISNGEDITDIYDVSTVTTADGVEYFVFKQIDPSKKMDVIFVKGSSGETKYYWYAGPDMLTSATVPGVNEGNDCGYGWHVIEGNPTSIETGELGTSDCQKINWVLAIPAKFGLNHISNGEDVTDAYDVTTVTCADGVEYIVFKQTSASKKTDRIFVKGSTSGEVFDPNSYYFYVGLTRPTSETDIAADLASNNTPLHEDMASMGWRKIGPDITIYNSSNPAYNGGGVKSTVCLDKNFNNVTCYVAIPVGMHMYDGLGNLTASWTLDQENITIKGHQYNVYVDTLEGEFGELIY